MARKPELERFKLSESLLAAVSRDAHDSVVVHDFDGRILAWNRAAESMLGVLTAAALGRNFTEFMPEHLHESVRATKTRLRDGEVVAPYESRRRNHNGRLLDVWVVISLLRNEAGTPYAVVTTDRDITAAKAAEQALRDTEGGLEQRVAARTSELQRISDTLRGEKELLRVTLASIGDAVVTTDLGGNITYLNPVAELLTGWTNIEARDIPLTQVFRILSEATREPAEDPVQKCLRDGQVGGLANPTLLIRRDGQELSIDDTAAPIHDSAGQIMGAVLVFRDVTEKRRLAAQLADQATHDPLTGLVNRREFMRRLTRLLDTQQVNDHHALLYLDLDQFKIINDSCGHVAGDELLRQISALLLSDVRSRDTLARIGGDEFGLLLEHCAIERAVNIADALRQKMLDLRFGWQDKVFTLGVSIGAVPITPGGSLTNVMSAADAACYAAKDLGRNRVHVYQPDDTTVMLRHGEMQWTSRIKNALAEGRFRLYYQPIVALRPSKKDATYGEILLRLVDEGGKLILPGEFIPAAERYELMGSIDRYVIRTCLENLSTLKAESPKTCSVNISGQSLGDPEFLDFFVTQLTKSGVLPTRLCFEITETAAISNLTHARRFIATLKEQGCRFALDDFGSGLSSFGYLQTLPVDYVKIDGRFVKNMVDNPIDRAMVESIHRIGHVMGLTTIAEWVENDATLSILRDIGVDYAQGLAIGHPIPF